MKQTIFIFLLFLTLTTITKADVFVSLRGDTIAVWDTAFVWCCGGVFFSDIKLSNDTIYVTECDTMSPTTCTCYFDVCTMITGLQPGTYTAHVTRRQEMRFQDTVVLHEEFAGSVQFTIVNATSLSLNTRLSQNSCRPAPQSVVHDRIGRRDFALLSVYPNPFNPTATIRYTVFQRGFISLVIYNILGQEVATLAKGTKDAGTYEVAVTLHNIASGVYICRLSTPQGIVSRNIVVQK